MSSNLKNISFLNRHCLPYGTPSSFLFCCIVDTTQGIEAAWIADIGQALGNNAYQEGFIISNTHIGGCMAGELRLTAPCAAKKQKVIISRC